MRLILTILLIGLFKADAQIVINASYPYRPYAQPAANLLLDDYPGAAAAYSLRKLDKDYSGSAIRVRRSNDNAEFDIGFTSSGDLDTASLKTFVGSNNAFVTTWYDQSGNSRNASQATAVNQARIANAGVLEKINSRPSVRFIASSNTIYNISPNIPLDTIYTGYYVTRRTSTSDYSFPLGADINPYFNVMANDNNTYLTARGTTSIVYATNGGTGNFLNFSSYVNGAYTYHKNNVLQTLTTPGTFAVGSNFLYLGGRSAVSSPANAIYSNSLISEIVYYNTNRTSNRTAIQTDVNTYYGIY